VQRARFRVGAGHSITGAMTRRSLWRGTRRRDRQETLDQRGGNETLAVGKTSTISAGDQIVLKTGVATIT